MTPIRAFVGHSFNSEDEAVVASFIDYFDQMKGALPDFDWAHARAAEPRELPAKVLKLVDGRNVFIGICTKRERVVETEKLQKAFFARGKRLVAESDLAWKTSDWIIQEIGLAIGRGMAIVLLVENGCRKPGGLQGDVEFIPFDRAAPERAFGRLLEMMRALSPKPSGGEVAARDLGETPEEESEKPSSAATDEVPDNSWDRQKFENAFVWRLISDDSEGAEMIEAAFLDSPYGVEAERLAEWKAMTEVWRIRFGHGSSLAQLRDCHEKFPANAEISEALASASSVLGMHSEAASQYLSAAELVIGDKADVERLKGLAAIEFSKSGDRLNAEQLLRAIRSDLKESTKDRELNYLLRMRDLSEYTDETYDEVEVLERIVQLSPDDWSTRFNLAYKYSKLNIRDMSLYHYYQIPYSERSAVAWNNLGVSYQEFSMPAKSVAAYKTAASKGESLAMSNLAYKLMQAGFTEEADQELQRALTVKDFHRNVGEAVSALKDIPAGEDKALKEAFKKVEPKRRFFQQLGAAISSPDAVAVPEKWAGPDCELTITIADGALHATGEYERAPNALSGLLSPPAKPTKVKLDYSGRILGLRVAGKLRKKSEGEASNLPTLGSFLGEGDETEFVMVIDAGGCQIAVAEQLSSTTPKFYALHPMGVV